MTGETQAETQEQVNDEAPFGYKADGTPRKRRAPQRRAVPRRSVRPEDQKSPERDHRPMNVRTTRRSRMPVDGLRRRLPQVDLGPDHVGRWVVDNDGGDRVMEFYRDRDYDFVKVRKGDPRYQVTDRDMGSNLSQVANRSVGGQKHYLMAKPRWMYEEDKKIKQQRNNATDEMLRTNRAQKDASGRTLGTANDPHFYVKYGSHIAGRSS